MISHNETVTESMYVIEYNNYRKWKFAHIVSETWKLLRTLRRTISINNMKLNNDSLYVKTMTF